MSALTLFDSLREEARTLRARYQLRRCAAIGALPRVRGNLWIHGPGSVFVGDRVFFDASSAPIELYAWEGATIVVGNDTYLGGGTSIEATESIRLGARNRVGTFCRIMDNHFHPLVGDRNQRPVPRPVVLGDDVFLGPRSIVLAGALVDTGRCFTGGSIIHAKRRPE